jgi:DNA (cytosine-5)-methyltransferase 1
MKISEQQISLFGGEKFISSPEEIPASPAVLPAKGGGKKDQRYLWPEYKRAITEIQPQWIVNENVPGTISNGLLDEKIGDLEALGYAWWPPFVIPASAVGAPHKRDRIWLVAYANAPRFQKRQVDGSLENKADEQKSWQDAAFYNGWTFETAVCGKHHGIPDRVDRIKALGNSIVPQVALQIFKAIDQYINYYP